MLGKLVPSESKNLLLPCLHRVCQGGMTAAAAAAGGASKRPTDRPPTGCEEVGAECGGDRRCWWK